MLCHMFKKVNIIVRVCAVQSQLFYVTAHAVWTYPLPGALCAWNTIGRGLPAQGLHASKYSYTHTFIVSVVV